MQTVQVHGNELLTEGIRSYLQALVAIGEFRRLVESRFHKAVDKHRDLIADALKVEIKSAAIQPYRDPEKLAPDFRGDWAAVGVRIPVGTSGCKEHTYYMGWWKEQANSVVGIIASMTFPEPLTAEKARSALRKAGLGPVDLKKATIYHLRELEFADIEQLQEQIEKLLGDWCMSWRAAGGLAKALRA
jgi:hypothetical protein